MRRHTSYGIVFFTITLLVAQSSLHAKFGNVFNTLQNYRVGQLIYSIFGAQKLQIEPGHNGKHIQPATSAQPQKQWSGGCRHVQDIIALMQEEKAKGNSILGSLTSKQEEPAIDEVSGNQVSTHPTVSEPKQQWHRGNIHQDAAPKESCIIGDRQKASPDLGTGTLDLMNSFELIEQETHELPLPTMQENSSQEDSPWLCKKKDNNGNWYDLKASIIEEKFHKPYQAFNYNTSISRIWAFVPNENNKKNNDFIVIPIIHGTYSAGDEYHNDAKITCQALKAYAQEQGNLHEKPVVLIAFKWSGCNSTHDRLRTSQYFSQIMNTFFSKNNSFVHVIAHSHGCQIVNHATRFLQKPLDKATYIASPIRYHEENFKPRNIKELTAFYSDTDTVQQLGSITTNFRSPTTVDSWRKYDYKQFKPDDRIDCIRNIRVLIDGQSPGHSAVKQVLLRLADIESAVCAFKHHQHTDFVVNVTLHKNLRNAGCPQIITVLHEESIPDMNATKNSQEQYIRATSLLLNNHGFCLFQKYFNRDINIKNNSAVRFLIGVQRNRGAVSAQDLSESLLN